MEIPKYYETFLPTLNILGDGQTLSRSEVESKVVERYYKNDLTAAQLNTRMKTGGILILNRIGWGLAYLKQAKLIQQPERAKFKITDKGKKALKLNKLTLKDIITDPDYLKYESKKKEQKKHPTKIINLGESPDDLIQNAVEDIESKVKIELLDKLKLIDPYYFQRVVLTLLEKMGYGEFVETPKSGDGGIDGIIFQDKLGLDKIYIQAKRYSENKVREMEMRNFIGAMSGDTTKGLFVTTSSFDDAATIKAKSAMHKIILIDGMKLTELMYKYSVGVQTDKTIEVKKVDEDFFESN